VCLVLDLACSDFLGSEIFRWDRLDLSSGPIFFCHYFSHARIVHWVRSSFGFLVSLRPQFRVFHFSATVFFFRLEAFLYVDFYSCLGCAVTKLLI
jgi:hypothetical protein